MGVSSKKIRRMYVPDFFLITFIGVKGKIQIKK